MTFGLTKVTIEISDDIKWLTTYLPVKTSHKICQETFCIIPPLFFVKVLSEILLNHRNKINSKYK